jgi:phosphomevalonate kinase
MSRRELRVPGNLLMFGEYAVLEQGGLGIAAAVAPYVQLRVVPARGFSFEGHMGARAISWQAGEEPEDDELLVRAASFLEARLAGRGVSLAGVGAHLVIDSSDFLGPSGTKRGFGSSAASTVALTEAACELAGVDDPRERFALAVGAHRHGQGGRGSGYDIAASFFGGIGLFRGGEAPEFEPLDAPWLPRLTLTEGGAASSTTHAVSRYAAWKAAHRDEATRYLQRSNTLIASLVRSRSWADARATAGELADLGLWLGDRIGVPARLPEQAVAGGGGYAEAGRQTESGVGTGGSATHRSLCKAVGAGSELRLCFAEDGGEYRPNEVTIDRKGRTWH